MDYASATFVCKEVKSCISKHLSLFANPSSLYKEGRDTNSVISKSRESVAKILNAKSDEIIFTSGATESNNLAIVGLVDKFLVDNPQSVPHIVTSNIEHSAILELIPKLKSYNVDVSVVPADANGIINPQDIKEVLKPNTILVSIMYANNEIGTIQNLREISKVIRNYKKHNHRDYGYPVFHTDAAQASNYLTLDTMKLGVDMMSLDGGKMYGLKGTGCLYKRRGINILPQIIGGGQENGMRAGTESVLNIVSFAKALEVAQSTKDKESARLKVLQDYFIQELLKINGTSINGDISERLPNNISVCIPGSDSEFLVYCLDECGIACSSASTCMNNKDDSYSYVIKNIRGDFGCEKSSLRFTLGRDTRKSDINYCIKSLKKVLLKQWNI
jgi:cysteine desulfurase